MDNVIPLTTIITSTQEFINDIRDMPTADPELVVYDILVYMGLSETAIKQAVGDRIYRKANYPSEVI